MNASSLVPSGTCAPMIRAAGESMGRGLSAPRALRSEVPMASDARAWMHLGTREPGN